MWLYKLSATPLALCVPLSQSLKKVKNSSMLEKHIGALKSILLLYIRPCSQHVPNPGVLRQEQPR